MYHLRGKGAATVQRAGGAGGTGGAGGAGGAARAGARWRALERRDASPLVAAAEGARRALQLVAAQVDLEGGAVPEEFGRGHLH